ncbi:MAG TPA: hypothetical protein VG692_20270 [Gemmatimonadales bacterium]|nr:hypothetical protein [Gemmatimonadales bacterium]
MYTTCLHCHANLGVNESVEAFQVGRRLAFDQRRGRLWAVCGSCHRWNLAPLDERWEAIEQCERLFRGTHIRTSTPNIGLARLKDGTELVRIGDPLRPEFAAWRYSNSIIRRRRRNLVIGGVAGAAVSATFVGVLATGVGLGMLQVANLGAQVWRKKLDARVVFRHQAAGGQRIEVTAGDLDDLELRIPGVRNDPTLVLELTREQRPSLFSRDRHVGVEGPDMMTLAGLAMARHNRTAGKPAHLQEAVELLDRAGNPFADPSSAEAWLGLQSARSGERYPPSGYWRGRLHLWRLDTPMRLALEMSAHEETERLYLASHLSVLEAAWREAEEVARIADDLLVPDWIRDRLG